MVAGFCALAVMAASVAGSSRCPTPEQVGERLLRLAPAAGGSDQVFVDAIPGGVELTLKDASGALLAQKELAGSADCGQLADAAAVVVAAWLSEFNALELAPPESPPPAKTKPQAAPAPEPASPWVIDAGIGLLVPSLSAPSIGLDFSVAATPDEARLGGVLTFDVVGPQPMAPSITWQRFSISAGPEARLAAGPVRLQLSFALEAALIGVYDRFPATSSTLFEFGAAARLRVIVRPFFIGGGLVHYQWTQAVAPSDMLVLLGGIAFGSG